MKKLNGKQIIIIVAAAVLFTAATVFVYLKHLRLEMTAEAGAVAGMVISGQQEYFSVYGEFIALEENSKSEALGISLESNKYFTLMRIEVMENTAVLYAVCQKGFFEGTELYVKYDRFKGVTDYKITEKTKIPLLRSSL